MALLAPFSAPGRFWRGNLHTHSNLSDGALEPRAVVDAYKNAGYDFMQLSEHFIGNFDFPIADTRGFRSNNFTTLIGAELHAPETAVGELWHIVAAGLPLDFPRNLDGETGAQVARRAHEAGAFIGIAHPAWSQLTIEDGRAIDCAHAVEIYNHGCAIENDRGDGWYLADQLLTEGKRLTAFATDDAHFKTPDHFGGWVHVKAESLDPDALLQSLKQGTIIRAWDRRSIQSR
jgi:predicted metal-dependent phosphoesterase TrpH